MLIGEAPVRQLEISAVVYPVCECGRPWTEHGACGGYKPSRPIENHGVVGYQSKSIIKNICWRLEQFFQRLRK